MRGYRNTTSKGEKSKWSKEMREKRSRASNWEKEAQRIKEVELIRREDK